VYHAVFIGDGKGNGTFQPAVTYGSDGGLLLSVVVANVNGDGKPDLVVANGNVCGTVSCDGSVGVVLGNGDGTFQPATTSGSGGRDAFSVALADVNGDGKNCNCRHNSGAMRFRTRTIKKPRLGDGVLGGDWEQL
jgi:hypothetical protein